MASRSSFGPAPGLVTRYEVSLADFKTTRALSVQLVPISCAGVLPLCVVWLAVPVSVVSLAPTSLLSTRLLEHPRSLARGKWHSRSGRGGGRKGEYGALAGHCGHPDARWLNGPGFRLPFLYPHMFLAANNFGMSQTWL